MKKPNLTLVLLALGIADLLGAIDATGVNVALPTIARELSIPISIAQWIPNIYTVILVAFLLFVGKIGDLIGPKKLYLIGLTLFGLSSLSLGFVHSAVPIIGFRAIQGLGTAILYTMPMSIIAKLWTEREKAFSVTASFFAFGMLIGPVLGGMFSNMKFGSFSGWHLLFLLNIPFVILSMIITLKEIPYFKIEKSGRVDILSFIIFFITITLIVLSLSHIISYYFILAGLLGFFLLYLYEKRLKEPLINVELFQNRTFFFANLLSFFSMITVIGMSFVLTFYLQETRHWDSFAAGLSFLPIPVATGIAAGLSSKIKNWKIGAILCSVLIMVGMIFLAFVRSDSSYFLVILPAITLIAGGGGIMMTVIFSAILGSAPIDSSGHTSGLLNMIQQLGGLISIAIVASIVFQYHLSFLVLTFIALLGLISAFFIENNKAVVQHD